MINAVGLIDGTSISHAEWYWVTWSMLISFYIPHLEKYMTGEWMTLAAAWEVGWVGGLVDRYLMFWQVGGTYILYCAPPPKKYMWW